MCLQFPIIKFYLNTLFKANFKILLNGLKIGFNTILILEEVILTTNFQPFMAY